MSVIKDIRYSFRTLLAKPAWLTIVLLTLSIGMGLTSTMFSLVNSILFKPLPLPDSHQLVEMTFETSTVKQNSASFAFYQQIKQEDTPLQSVSFAAYDQGVLSQGEQHSPLTLRITSGDFLQLFEVPAMLGRWYDESDVGKNVVVLGYDAWLRYFDGASDIVGKSITINKLAYTVLGVMPAGFGENRQNTPAYWAPIEGLQRPGAIYGRLKDGVTLAQAQLQTQSLEAIVEKFSEQNRGEWHVHFTSLKDKSVEGIKPALWLLTLASAAVFLIAIINVVNLTFVHYMERTHELSVRVAVGASRRRLISQLLTESLLIAVMGGVLGLLLTAWSLEALKIFAIDRIPRLNEVGMDVMTLAMTFSLVLLAGLITALLPALRLLKPEYLAMALKESGGKSTDSRNSHGIRQTLVAAEVTLAVVLLIGAGLLLRSYSKLMAVDPGFTAEQRVTGHIWLPDSYSSRIPRLTHWNALLERAEALPEVTQAAVTTTLPMGVSGIDYNVPYSFDEAQTAGNNTETNGAIRSVSPKYFDVLEIPLLEGRVFDERDVKGSAPVVIINEALAKTLWQDVSPVGRTLILPDWNGGPRRIIGIVSNVKHNGLRAEVEPEFFVPMDQQTYVGMSLIAQVRPGTEQKVLRAIGAIATELDVSAPLIVPNRLDRLTVRSVDEERVLLQIIAVFSALSLLMACIGVYGVSANMVGQKTREIGVRMALGASPKRIRSWVLKDALKPVFLGAISGIILALLMVEVIASYLYGIWRLDPIVYLMVPAILVCVAVLATWWPARQATSVNPQYALKHE